ncbi:hypothetical protein PV10_04264 [Exophiala mesophila]|uniref:Uncharacterized protein n=1 Tax=Exophiala mesophila TaxID=212818 RepID=A0A0D1ZGY1_EXOME|nr:uncharacterized protein PV10_04264 [Exophiala mesophila]KIV93019.1 hypothetical protein PV10_04264 [Exophiala mesophila]
MQKHSPMAVTMMIIRFTSMLAILVMSAMSVVFSIFVAFLFIARPPCGRRCEPHGLGSSVFIPGQETMIIVTLIPSHRSWSQLFFLHRCRWLQLSLFFHGQCVYLSQEEGEYPERLACVYIYMYIYWDDPSGSIGLSLGDGSRG